MSREPDLADSEQTLHSNGEIDKLEPNTRQHRSNRKSMPIYSNINQFTKTIEISQRRNSRVVKATCGITGMELALKCFQKDALTPKEAVHVAREVGVLSMLKGEAGIVHILGCFEDDTHCYIVMEHCAGRDLYHKFITDISFSEEFVCTKVLIPLLTTLSRLHGHFNVVHRDIKPENLLLTASGELKLADFGTAIKQDVEVPFLPVGTLDFMAPEVLGSHAPRGSVESPCTTVEMLEEHNLKPYNEKADVWSVGALAYELMVGETPFYNTDIDETKKIILGSAYLYFPQKMKHTSFAHFVRQALQKDPASRPSAEELLQHSWLTKYQGGHQKLSLGTNAFSAPVKSSPTATTVSPPLLAPPATTTQQQPMTIDLFVDTTTAGNAENRIAKRMVSQHGISPTTAGVHRISGRRSGSVNSPPCVTLLSPDNDNPNTRPRSLSVPVVPTWAMEKYPVSSSLSLPKSCLRKPGKRIITSQHDGDVGDTNGDAHIVQALSTALLEKQLSRITERSFNGSSDHDVDHHSSSSSREEGSRRGSRSVVVVKRPSSRLRKSSNMSEIQMMADLSTCSDSTSTVYLGPGSSTMSEEREGAKQGRAGQLNRIKSYLRTQKSSWLKSFGSLKSTRPSLNTVSVE